MGIKGLSHKLGVPKPTEDKQWKSFGSLISKFPDKKRTILIDGHNFALACCQHFGVVPDYDKFAKLLEDLLIDWKNDKKLDLVFFFDYAKGNSDLKDETFDTRFLRDLKRHKNGFSNIEEKIEHKKDWWNFKISGELSIPIISYICRKHKFEHYFGVEKESDFLLADYLRKHNDKIIGVISNDSDLAVVVACTFLQSKEKEKEESLFWIPFHFNHSFKDLNVFQVFAVSGEEIANHLEFKGNREELEKQVESFILKSGNDYSNVETGKEEIQNSDPIQNSRLMHSKDLYLGNFETPFTFDHPAYSLFVNDAKQDKISSDAYEIFIHKRIKLRALLEDYDLNLILAQDLFRPVCAAWCCLVNVESLEFDCKDPEKPARQIQKLEWKKLFRNAEWTKAFDNYKETTPLFAQHFPERILILSETIHYFRKPSDISLSAAEMRSKNLQDELRVIDPKFRFALVMLRFFLSGISFKKKVENASIIQALVWSVLIQTLDKKMNYETDFFIIQHYF